MQQAVYASIGQDNMAVCSSTSYSRVGLIAELATGNELSTQILPTPLYMLNIMALLIWNLTLRLGMR